MKTYKVGCPDPFGGLWQIAQHFKVSFDAIKQANPQLAMRNWALYGGELLNIPVPEVSPTISPTPANYTGSEPPVAVENQCNAEPDSVFEIQGSNRPPNTRPIYDDKTGAVVGYVYGNQSYVSKGFYKYYDIEGNVVATDEDPVETPILDPIDIVMIVGDLAVVAGKGALALGVRIAAKGGTRIILRALAIDALDAMRVAFKKVISMRTLRFTVTTAGHMAEVGRYVPVHILKLAIRYGLREADPQGVKGLFQYSIKMSRNGKDYLLKLILRESDHTVMHFEYKPFK